MGYEARAHAHLTKEERQDRRLRRAARNFRDLEHLYGALTGMAKADWTRCLDVMWSELTFDRSDASRRFLEEKLTKDNEFIARQYELAKALKAEASKAARRGDIAGMGVGVKAADTLFDDDDHLVAAPSWVLQLAQMRGVPAETLLPSAAQCRGLVLLGQKPIVDITLEEARTLWGDQTLPPELVVPQPQEMVGTEVEG